MRKLEIKIIDVFFLCVCFIIGMSTSLVTAQVASIYRNKNLAEEYARSLLLRAEDVAESVNNSLNYLNSSNKDYCSSDDKEILVRSTYEYRFIEDAGRINGAIIKCSAMRGLHSSTYNLTDKINTSKNGTSLWNRRSGYLSKKINMYIISRGGAFIVLSPYAYNAYKNPPDGINARLISINGDFIQVNFGKNINIDSFLTTTSRICSKKYDVCSVVSSDSNISHSSRKFLIPFIINVGIILSTLNFIIIKQFSKKIKSMSYRLRKAVKKEIISVNYQPIVFIETGEIMGFEVLARWTDNHFGIIPPDTFIKEANLIGIQDELNRLIIRKSICESREILYKNKNIYISINISINDIIDHTLIVYIKKTLEEFDIPPHQISLEILESSTADFESIERSLDKAKEIGFGIFIDDFGTGYSSLSYLAKLKVDKVKIDKVFTQSITTNSPASLILKKICEISYCLGFDIIFEGIETEEQRHDIVSLYPKAMGQGWLFSKAVSIDGVRDILGKNLLLQKPNPHGN